MGVLIDQRILTDGEIARELGVSGPTVGKARVAKGLQVVDNIHTTKQLATSISAQIRMRYARAPMAERIAVWKKMLSAKALAEKAISVQTNDDAIMRLSNQLEELNNAIRAMRYLVPKSVW
ncbi:MAG: hypothetical protein Q8N60_03460 [Candidatus Diapherotrites archaeon]|nr:hypothetical protein [Candidatus Diapherotrites archaeon]